MNRNPSYLPDIVDATEPPAARQRPEDLHRSVLALGKALVLAPLSCRTDLRVALVHQHAVDTLRVHAARVLVRGLAVTARDLRQVRGHDLHSPYRPVDLEETKG